MNLHFTLVLNKQYKFKASLLILNLQKVERKKQ